MSLRRTPSRRQLLSIVMAVLCLLSATNAWTALAAQWGDGCPTTCPAHNQKRGCHGATGAGCPHHRSTASGLCAPGCQHATTNAVHGDDPALLPVLLASSDLVLRSRAPIEPQRFVKRIALDPPFHPPPLDA
ncbi:MAG TPA: hypothetical protein VMW17_14820 [Candidatus Binatia bacterium]|nr:hypothetical protein [Candidatus Binatia bacterium]